MKLTAAKQISISLGLYRPMRLLHRNLIKAERRKFAEHRALMSQFLKPGNLAFDVGANIGDRSEIMLSLGASVVAFEPQARCAREIRARNNGKLIVVEKAVGASIGEADFHVKAEPTLSTFISDSDVSVPDIGIARVKITTLDAAIKEFGKPDFCKIDVEGFEPQVLHGLSEPLHVLSLEYSSNARGVNNVSSCLEMLSRFARPMSINLIGGEGSEWLLPKWVSKEDFLGTFPSCTGGYPYGDLYVRLADV